MKLASSLPSISPINGILGQKIIPHNYLEIMRETSSPNVQLISKLDNIHKNYFKFMKQSNGEIENNLELNNDFFRQRPRSKAGEELSQMNNQAKSIIYQLSKVHSNNRRKSCSFLNSNGNDVYKNGDDYQKIEMKTLGLVDFKEENLVDI